MEKPRFLTRGEREAWRRSQAGGQPQDQQTKRNQQQHQNNQSSGNACSNSQSAKATSNQLLASIWYRRNEIKPQLPPSPPSLRYPITTSEPKKQDANLPKQPVRRNGKFQFDWSAEDDTTLNDDVELLQMREQLLTQQQGQGKRKAEDDLMDRGADSSTSGRHSSKYRKGKKQTSDALGEKLHWSQKPLASMTERDWRIFKEDHKIVIRTAFGGGNSPAETGDTKPKSIQSKNIPNPARDWQETGLLPEILRLVQSVTNYDKPTPIQKVAVPVALNKQDLIGLAETGSGKTAAFVLPMIQYVWSQPKMTSEIAAYGPYALVLAPTRELALQIEAESKRFANRLGFRVCCVIGGQDVEMQATEIRSGCEILIATPGRMMDCLESQYVVLNQCYFLVMDEADRMLDMGFEPQVQRVLNAMPHDPPANMRVDHNHGNQAAVGKAHEVQIGGSKRQTFMFSATMSPGVEKIARQYMDHPVLITVGEVGRATALIDQRVEFVASETVKRKRLIELLKVCRPPIMVFVNTKRGCDMVNKFIESEKISLRTAVLHSGKSQDIREDHMEKFRKGDIDMIIATDVLGRGINVEKVNHVINFEMPTQIDNYIHRIGRTGRAGERGTAWSLVTGADEAIIPELVEHLAKSKSKCPPELLKLISASKRNFSLRGPKDHIID